MDHTLVWGVYDMWLCVHSFGHMKSVELLHIIYMPMPSFSKRIQDMKQPKTITISKYTGICFWGFDVVDK